MAQTLEKKPVIIFGGSGIARVAYDIFVSNGVEVFCFLDDDEKLHGTEIGEVSIMGRTDDDGYLKYIGLKCDAFVASDEAGYRESIVDLLKDRRKVMPVNAVHGQAVISSFANLGYGNLIGQGAQVASFAKVENHCIIRSGAIVDSDVELADFVQVGAGAVINSGAKIEEGAFIGSGAILVSGITVGKKARIGAGSVVVRDVDAGSTVFGNPAQEVK